VGLVCVSLLGVAVVPEQLSTPRLGDGSDGWHLNRLAHQQVAVAQELDWAFRRLGPGRCFTQTPSRWPAVCLFVTGWPLTQSGNQAWYHPGYTALLQWHTEAGGTGRRICKGCGCLCRFVPRLCLCVVDWPLTKSGVPETVRLSPTPAVSTLLVCLFVTDCHLRRVGGSQAWYHPGYTAYQCWALAKGYQAWCTAFRKRPVRHKE
jgi:hypothetical protein